ncbi:MAG: RagB/SusD family nutrient uptake outer membrane protein [Bacteroidia bacterium]|nr:MAG: RagB/SusD family nutrient uptake outer membrane protein [Bacteroidia bacterium]
MKYLNKFLIVVLSAVVFTSCSKKLELFPYSSIATGQSLTSVSDAEYWNTGMYASLKGNVYGIFMFSTDVQSDLLNSTLDYGNRNGAPHRWDFNDDDYTIRDTWSGYYSALKNVNYFIANASKISTNTQADADKLNRYISEAHWFRAFYYSNLILRWGKAYDPATAANELGVPLVLDFDVAARPARATMKQVYDQILDDITKAKTGLAAVAGTKGSNKLSIDAVLALEARVKLYMQDWAGAKAAADAVIAKNVYPLVNTAAAMKSLWVNDSKDETLFMLFANNSNQGPGQTNSIYLGYTPATKFYRPDFVPVQWIVDLFDNNDIRKGVYFKSDSLDIQGVKYQNISLVHKYEGNPALFTGANTNYAHAQKVLRSAELYLISAEAGYKSSGDALTPLNALRTARGLAATNATGTALYDLIKDERTRELAFEGFRLDDLKRWNEPMTRKAAQNTAFINVGANFNQLSKPAGDNKFVWGLPANDITINKNLVQNAGW